MKILMDTRGPEIRTGTFEVYNSKKELKVGLQHMCDGVGTCRNRLLHFVPNSSQVKGLLLCFVWKKVDVAVESQRQGRTSSWSQTMRRREMRHAASLLWILVFSKLRAPGFGSQKWRSSILAYSEIFSLSLDSCPTFWNSSCPCLVHGRTWWPSPIPSISALDYC